MFAQMVLLVSAVLASSHPAEKTVQVQVNRPALQEEVGDISGYYTCKGQEVGGKTYNGIALVAKKNDVYVIQWMVAGGATFTGVAVRQGATFAASWAMAGDKGLVRGVNLYRIEPGPRLVGRWATLPGPGYMQNETLTFLKDLEEEEE